VGVVLVSLREIPFAVRWHALHAALTEWPNDAENLVAAVVAPSEVTYPVDAEAYRETQAAWNGRRVA
jgi:hypothetical protein